MTVFEKIAAQQTEERTPVWMVGEQLKDIIRGNLQMQELVLQDLERDGMSLADCEKKIKAFADSHKTHNFACVTPAEADRIIRKFYGLPGGDKQEVIEPQKSAEQSTLRLEDFF